jgi:hypothetical protein
MSDGLLECPRWEGRVLETKPTRRPSTTDVNLQENMPMNNVTSIYREKGRIPMDNVTLNSASDYLFQKRKTSAPPLEFHIDNRSFATKNQPCNSYKCDTPQMKKNSITPTSNINGRSKQAGPTPIYTYSIVNQRVSPVSSVSPPKAFSIIRNNSVAYRFVFSNSI